ncbi:MAG: AMP phosphorylase [Desulfurococcaceae archaeon]|nr:AMP phosphorylase [Desulfurococcaceae archaeon]
MKGLEVVTLKVSRAFQVKILDIELERPVVIVNQDDASQLGLGVGDIVLLTIGDKHVSAIAGVSKTMVKSGEILIPRGIALSLGVSEGEVVGLKPLGLPPSFQVLKKRLRGERLSEGEFSILIRDIVNGLYGSSEIAAFLVSQLFQPLTDQELSYLIKAMVETGVKVKFEEIAYDIHSIGGVPGNSKVALLSVPIVAASGLLIPKTSSRAITSPAGTADTMEVLARVDLTIDEIVEIARKVKGVLAWGGRLNLAPADDIFVSVERRLAIDPDQQMVASILSKKLAMGIDKLLIDIPVGKGSKVESVNRAEEIAALFIRQGTLLNMSVKVAITYGGQPIGMSVGPALEAREALKAHIERRGSRSLIDKAIHLAGLVLEMSGKAQPGTGADIAREIFVSGKAYEKFREIIGAQGGNPNIKPEEVPVGRYTYTLKSPLEGAVTHIDNAAINMIARALGAPADKGAGVEFHAKVGYRVNKGDPLITLYSNSESRLDEAISLLNEYKPIIVEGMLIKAIP